MTIVGFLRNAPIRGPAARFIGQHHTQRVREEQAGRLKRRLPIGRWTSIRLWLVTGGGYRFAE
jgi:hypothetical protein